MKPQPSNKQKTERGQAFMELAISLVFLLVLLTVMVDLGWAFYTLIAMRDTVQEAAAYGSMCPMDEGMIENRLLNSAHEPLDISTISPTDVDIEYVESNGTPIANVADVERGDSIKVTLHYNHQIVVPFVSTFIGRTTYPLEVTVADTVLKDDNDGCFEYTP